MVAMVASSEESANVPSMTMAETATSEDEYESAMSDNWLDVITGVKGFDFSVELFLDESSLFLSLALSDVFFLALDLASEESVVPSSAESDASAPVDCADVCACG